MLSRRWARMAREWLDERCGSHHSESSGFFDQSRIYEIIIDRYHASENRVPYAQLLRSTATPRSRSLRSTIPVSSSLGSRLRSALRYESAPDRRSQRVQRIGRGAAREAAHEKTT